MYIIIYERMLRVYSNVIIYDVRYATSCIPYVVTIKNDVVKYCTIYGDNFL